MIAGNLCSIKSDHLIQYLIEPSSYIHNSSKEKITKRCCKNFDKENFKPDLGKVNWQMHCKDREANSQKKAEYQNQFRTCRNYIGISELYFHSTYMLKGLILQRTF